VLVELDQHPGVVLDIPQPSRHHVHTIIRTPNGGDYGLDLLARHHAEFDHDTGSHALWFPRNRGGFLMRLSG
jgi:hypothetical protein